MALCNFGPSNKDSQPSALDNEKFFLDTHRLKQKLKKLNKKSAGFDHISIFTLKHLTPNFIRNLTIIFNNALNLGYFPAVWKQEKILAIPKKSTANSASNNFRPISLLSNLGKLYESIINDLIIDFSANKIIPDNQFGFRQGHFTIHAIHKLTADIN